MFIHEFVRTVFMRYLRYSLRLYFGRLRVQGLFETLCLQTGLLYAVFIYIYIYVSCLLPEAAFES